LLIAAEYLHASGFVVLAPRNYWGAKWLFAFRKGTAIEIDLIPFLFRGPVLLVGRPRSTGRIGPFKVDSWAGFAKRVVMPILGNALPKEPFLPSSDEQAVREHCDRLFGRKLAQRLFGSLQGRDERGLLELAAKLRTRSVLRSLLGHPLRSAGLVAPWLRKTLLSGQDYNGAEAPPDCPESLLRFQGQALETRNPSQAGKPSWPSRAGS
jgi:hypothetical protein